MIACLMLYSMHYDIHSGSLKISWNCFCYFNKSNSGKSFWKGEREGKNLTLHKKNPLGFQRIFLFLIELFS